MSSIRYIGKIARISERIEIQQRRAADFSYRPRTYYYARVDDAWLMDGPQIREFATLEAAQAAAEQAIAAKRVEVFSHNGDAIEIVRIAGTGYSFVLHNRQSKTIFATTAEARQAAIAKSNAIVSVSK